MSSTPNKQGALPPGTKIGRYQLIELIDVGGFGEVYLAEQLEPVRRRVALKIIKLGLDTKEFIARFEVERQALALMEHPNIASVLDAGATENGRPYFVMELAQGERITDFCDQQHYNTRQRLDLFIQVCNALQHAHQKGIIHRDIKPSNILIALQDGVPVPKVIDFGIAKAIQQRLTDKTLITTAERLIGTPMYMSPEQTDIARFDFDTRSDIYSLGVLLYELLTGLTPFDQELLVRGGLDVIRETICNVDPVIPSRRLRSLKDEARAITAARHSTPVDQLADEIQDDLDWIIMKCLEKDRARRYDTANGLAMDLKRHLADEPVLARPPTTTYRLQKAWRRNRAACIAAACIIAVLLAATAFSSWQAVRAHRAEVIATQRSEESDAIAKFLGEVFQRPDSKKDVRTLTMVDGLNAAAKKLETRLTNQPARHAALELTLGQTYFSLGLYREAIPLEERARDFYLTHSGPEHPDTQSAQLSLASAYDAMSRVGDALKIREEVFQIRRKTLGPEHGATINAMIAFANSCDETNRTDEALRLREEVLRLRRQTLGPDNAATLSALNGVAISYNKIGRKEEAARLYAEAYTNSVRLLGRENLITLTAAYNLSWILLGSKRYEEALQLQEEIQPLFESTLGPEHSTTLKALVNLSYTYEHLKRLDKALEVRQKTLELYRKALGPEHPETLVALDNLSKTHRLMGNQEMALQLSKELVPLIDKVFGRESEDAAWARANAAMSAEALSRREEALKLREEVLAVRRKLLPRGHDDTIRVLKELATSYEEAGRSDEAAALRREAAKVGK